MSGESTDDHVSHGSETMNSSCKQSAPDGESEEADGDVLSNKPPRAPGDTCGITPVEKNSPKDVMIDFLTKPYSSSDLEKGMNDAERESNHPNNVVAEESTEPAPLPGAVAVSPGGRFVSARTLDVAVSALLTQTLRFLSQL